MSHLDAELVDELDGERCVLTRHDHLPLRKVDHAADVTRASEELGAIPDQGSGRGDGRDGNSFMVGSLLVEAAVPLRV